VGTLVSPQVNQGLGFPQIISPQLAFFFASQPPKQRFGFPGRSIQITCPFNRGIKVPRIPPALFSQKKGRQGGGKKNGFLCLDFLAPSKN